MKPKLYLSVYQTKPPDYEAITRRAEELGLKLEFGGGRKCRNGESPNAQIIFNLKNIGSKIHVSRTGKIIIYYPSKPCLEKCILTLISSYMPVIDRSEIICEGPVDPLSKAFELRRTENWNGTGKTLLEATVVVHQWLDPKNGEYTFVLPDYEGRIIPPKDLDFEYAGNCGIRIKTIDKDDEKGNRILTGERVRWQAMKKLERISKMCKLTQENLRNAKTLKNERKSLDEVDLIFEIL